MPRAQVKGLLVLFGDGIFHSEPQERIKDLCWGAAAVITWFFLDKKLTRLSTTRESGTKAQVLRRLLKTAKDTGREMSGTIVGSEPWRARRGWQLWTNMESFRWFQPFATIQIGSIQDWVCCMGLKERWLRKSWGFWQQRLDWIVEKPSTDSVLKLSVTSVLVVSDGISKIEELWYGDCRIRPEIQRY